MEVNMKSLLKSNNPVHISSVKEKKPQNFILSILLITLVIDIMGVGLVLPLVPDLVLNKNSHIFFSHIAITITDSITGINSPNLCNNTFKTAYRF